MAFITFLSDFGEEDHYVSAVKASILQTDPSLQVIDISHHVDPFDIGHGAFVLKSVYRDFPEGTVHLVAVNSVVNPGGRYIGVKLDGHYFVGADNGLISLVNDGDPELIIELEQKEDVVQVSPVKLLLACVAARIAGGEDMKKMGKKVDDYYRLLARQIKATKKQISGSVVRVDHYGNLITNIEKKIFDMVHKDRPLQVKFGKEQLGRIHFSYTAVEPGECFAVFNSMGYLEIGINKGHAAELLGLGYDSPVILNFSENE